MFDLNFMSVANTAQAVADGMVARGFGRIVAIASLAGLKGYAYVSAYCAAKHAAVGLVRALAVEFAGTGVTVNAVCPGYTDTDLVRESIDKSSRKPAATATRRSPRCSHPTGRSASSRRPRWRRRCSVSARREATTSPAKPCRSMAGHEKGVRGGKCDARCGNQSLRDARRP
jgi:NAD(P)-dependent dehydrogenase (short-subunit alcohol dehydrogenase family)